MPKAVKIVFIVLLIIFVACLIGLIVTGYMIGWGPFATLRYYNRVTYDITDSKYDYVREKHTIEGPNGTIAGYLFIPDNGKQTQQIVILSHGLATEQWHNLNTADSLASAGIMVFMFDYCGGSVHSESDGETTQMSVLTEKEDLNAVIDHVKTWDSVDPEKIGIIGYSQGGLVAALAAAERDDIAKLCLIYPAFSMYEEIVNTYSSVDEIPEEINRNGMLTGKCYYADILAMGITDIYQYAAQYTGPVMIQHGTADALVPYASSVTAAAYYQNCKLVTLDGAGHGFSGDDDVFSVLKEFEFFTQE